MSQQVNTPFDYTQILENFSEQNRQWIEYFTLNFGSAYQKEVSVAYQELISSILKDPAKWVELQTKFVQMQTSLLANFWGKAMGTTVSPVIAPEKSDKRFNAPEWEENPIFDFIKQSYLLTSQWMLEILESFPTSQKYKQQLNYAFRQYIDAISPTNYFMTNPEVLNLAMQTKGKSLVDGFQNMLEDMKKGRISMTDDSYFKIGENIAVTPGSVVFENDLIQLIQYKPTTENVYDTPLIIVPPFINKFYILDLSPENSFAKFIVEQGFTVFMVSWKNPKPNETPISWDDYVSEGVLKATEVAKSICKSSKVNALGFCIGGTALGCALAIQATKRAKPIQSATFLATMLDFSDTGEISVFVDEQQVKQREHKIPDNGVLSGNELASAFASLRANDLVWNYVVTNYLKGENPPPFDLLYWNGDPTNLPGKMYNYYLRNMYLENNIVKPDCLTMCDTKINLRKIDTPTYMIATKEDHIAPWRTVYKGAQLFSGSMEFVLGASGHIAGIVNPASKNKRNFWKNPNGIQQNSDSWLETAESVPGSWWKHWIEWLKNYGGKTIPARKELGNENHPEIEPAPGKYVKETI